MEGKIKVPKGKEVFHKIEEIPHIEDLKPYPQYPIKYGEPFLPEPTWETKWYS